MLRDHAHLVQRVQRGGGDIGLAIDERAPLACIAAIWTNWTPLRKEGGTTNDLFTFLTPEPHLEVGAIILEQSR
ncbi:hypothetical protein BSZ19_35370 [Bradyrhizobium japonicum]|uniref:Uncharacterized protein n=1 Tax=Bradyrhizobium japonicum TaxID=375 RepID=A0A1Y2JEA5_BRAJP|nr:hypothetical protein BSZ19_35370 [Bradyrhizobium japonicum]